jgi:hypothetical protein
MDVLARFSRVWCPSCNKTQPMIFDVMKANDKNDHDAAEGGTGRGSLIDALLMALGTAWAALQRGGKPDRKSPSVNNVGDRLHGWAERTRTQK